MTINYNKSAEIALQSLTLSRRDLSSIQMQVATGRKINSAVDSSSVWSISTHMQSDIGVLRQVKESLWLSHATLDVARSASEQISSALAQVKQDVIAAREENVDRSVVQRDIAAMREQVSTIVESAEFNGLNLLQGGDDIAVLSSLNRTASNVSEADYLTIQQADLRFFEGAPIVAAIVADEPGGIIMSSNGLIPSTTQSFTLVSPADGTAGINAGYTFTIEVTPVLMAGISPIAATYVAQEGDTINDVAEALIAHLEDEIAALEAAAPGSSPNVSFSSTLPDDPTQDNAIIYVTNNEIFRVFALSAESSSFTPTGGDLRQLADIDVSTASNAEIDSWIQDVEEMISSANDAAASFGIVQRRIESQASFIDTLSTSIEAGVATLTDINLAAASARLRALEVQQQLQISALQIANRSPVALLELF